RLLGLRVCLPIAASALPWLIPALVSTVFTRCFFARGASLLVTPTLRRDHGLCIGTVEGNDLRFTRRALPAIATSAIAPLVARSPRIATTAIRAGAAATASTTLHAVGHGLRVRRLADPLRLLVDQLADRAYRLDVV